MASAAGGERTWELPSSSTPRVAPTGQADTSAPAGSGDVENRGSAPTHWKGGERPLPSELNREPTMLTITPFLWFDTQAEEAMNYYASIFPRAKVLSLPRANGRVVSVEYALEDQKFMALNAGPLFKFNEAVSFFVGCDTQQEIDTLWDKLTADGGAPGRCGWVKDKCGFFWPVV